MCGTDDNPYEILLCDGCDGPFHLACVGLKRVPKGDWLCAACDPKAPSTPANLTQRPVKGPGKGPRETRSPAAAKVCSRCIYLLVSHLFECASSFCAQMFKGAFNFAALCQTHMKCASMLCHCSSKYSPSCHFALVLVCSAAQMRIRFLWLLLSCANQMKRASASRRCCLTSLVMFTHTRCHQSSGY